MVSEEVAFRLRPEQWVDVSQMSSWRQEASKYGEEFD